MSLQEHLYMNLVQDKRYLYFLEGLKNTLIITFFALVIGVALGFIIGMVRSTYDRTGKGKIANGICQFYLTIMRGTPAVIQLMIFYYCIFTSRIFSGVFVGIIAFGLNSAAYVAEIIRSGIMSIPRGKWRPADLLASATGKQCAISLCHRRFEMCFRLSLMSLSFSLRRLRWQVMLRYRI